jgi:hypothetical protein
LVSVVGSDVECRLLPPGGKIEPDLVSAFAAADHRPALSTGTIPSTSLKLLTTRDSILRIQISNWLMIDLDPDCFLSVRIPIFPDKTSRFDAAETFGNAWPADGFQGCLMVIVHTDLDLEAGRPDQKDGFIPGR